MHQASGIGACLTEARDIMHQALAHIIDPGETRPRRGLPREGAAPGAPRHGATCPPELLRRPDPGASRPRGDLPPKRPATERFARPSSWSQPTPKRNNFPVEKPQPPFCLELFNASSLFSSHFGFRVSSFETCRHEAHLEVGAVERDLRVLSCEVGQDASGRARRGRISGG